MSELDSVAELRDQWKTLYQKRLPSLAKARSPAQARWPVVLDHCFARIVLDNAIGIDQPWNDVLAAPAVKHMSLEQLIKALELGEQIANGTADLVELDNHSLVLRGKNEKQGSKKRKAKEDEHGRAAKALRSQETRDTQREEPVISSYFLPSPQSHRLSVEDTPASPLSVHGGTSQVEKLPGTKNADAESEVAGAGKEDDMAPHLARIRNAASLTSFRKLTLSLLCQVPRGRYSTYGAMAGFVSGASHSTCARAVGNAMRNNPFAPGVPCHRILAGDGTLGGFKGHWGEGGKYAADKRRILAEEGVKFDSQGKVKGRPFKDFWLPEGLGKGG